MLNVAFLIDSVLLYIDVAADARMLTRFCYFGELSVGPHDIFAIT